jgi:hypothetical protein
MYKISCVCNVVMCSYFYPSTLLDSYNLIDYSTEIELCIPTAYSEYILGGTKVI